MLSSFFAWVRRQMRDAVLGGVADAWEALDGAEDPGELLREHRREPEQLPAPEAETARNGRGRVKA